jgi:hypothetical protein
MDKRTIIARRRFQLHTKEGADRSVNVALCAPTETGPDEWVCWFRIAGLGGALVGREAQRLAPLKNGWGRAFAVDGVGALFNGLVAVRRYLHFLAKERSGTLLLWGVPDLDLPDGRAELRSALKARRLLRGK